MWAATQRLRSCGMGGGGGETSQARNGYWPALLPGERAGGKRVSAVLSLGGDLEPEGDYDRLIYPCKSCSGSNKLLE